MCEYVVKVTEKNRSTFLKITTLISTTNTKHLVNIRNVINNCTKSPYTLEKNYYALEK